VEIADIDNRGKISLVPVAEEGSAEEAAEPGSAPADAAAVSS
jgi:polyribonucleotide nucleotidyltransferase